MLAIPEPCNEDFSKMTPTQRGAFCSKCEIDTFDFRNLSNHQINKVILENKGKHMCGQFTNVQLDSLNQGFLDWKNQKKKTFRSKFVLALILVFGLSLFSCDTQEKQTITELQSLELVQSNHKTQFVNDVLEERNLDLVDYVITEVEVIPVEVIVPVEPVMCELPVDVIGGDIVEMEEVHTTAGVPIDYPHMLAGGITSVTYSDYLEDTLIQDNEVTILPEVVQVNPDYYEAKAYPNPTTTDATVELNVFVEEHFEILLFDMTGRLVSTIFNGDLSEGRQRFPLDLSYEEAGMYIIKVVALNQLETIKVQKL